MIAHDPYPVDTPLQHECTVGRWRVRFYERDEFGDGVVQFWLGGELMLDEVWQVRSDYDVLEIEGAEELPLTDDEHDAMCRESFEKLEASVWYSRSGEPHNKRGRC